MKRPGGSRAGTRGASSRRRGAASAASSPSPSYQGGVAGIGAYRGVPDVAADACPHTGFPVVMSNAGGGYTLSGHGGTSASAPLWAGVIAVADQYAGRRLGFVNAAIYRIARSPTYHQAFHDVTTGDNAASFPPKTISGYEAPPGWDAVTGWGSPDASVLVPLLARYVQADDAKGL